MRSRGAVSYWAGLISAGTVLLVAAAAMLWFETSLDLPNVGRLLDDGKLSDAQAQAVRVMLDLSQLLLGWALAIIGATGFFLRLNIEKNIALRPVDLLLALAIILTAVASLFFGHLVLDQTAQILASYKFPLRDDALRRLSKYQYLSFFSSVMLFGFHVFQFFWARIQADVSKADGR